MKALWLGIKTRLKQMPKWLKVVIIIGLIAALGAAMIMVKTARGSAVPVQSAKVSRQDLERSVITSGRLKAVEEQEFFTPEESTVMELNVKLGDRVKKGDILGRLDTLELERKYQTALANLAGKKAELARAEAQDDELNLEEAQASYEKAKNQLERVNSLYAAGAASLTELENAKVELLRANTIYQQARTKVEKSASSLEISALKAQCDLAAQQVAQAKERLDMGTFVAREDGVVIAVDTKKGSKVMEGTRIIVIGNDQNLEVSASVNEIDAGSIKVGQPVAISCMSLPGQEFAGKVSRVGAAAIVQSGSSGENVNIPVTVRLNSHQDNLKIGYTVDMTIKTATMRDVISVPIEALFERNGRTMVYVIKNGMLKERVIKTRPGNELYDVAVKGLKANEEIVLNPDPNLKPGQKVTTAPKGEKK